MRSLPLPLPLVVVPVDGMLVLVMIVAVDLPAGLSEEVEARWVAVGGGFRAEAAPMIDGVARTLDGVEVST